MEIIKPLLEKFTDKEMELLSTFFGEEAAYISKGLETSLGAVLQDLTKVVENDPDKLAKVLLDGGHTGDILDDLQGLFKNADKTQLIVTIGNNINNHFFGDKAASTAKKISSISGLKKTSSSSLYGLATPLLLGFIGKEFRSKNLSVSDLKAALLGRTGKLIPAEEPKQKTLKKQKKKKTNHSTWFHTVAWVGLAALLFAALFYSLRERVFKEKPSEVTFHPETSLPLEKSMALPDSLKPDTLDAIPLPKETKQEVTFAGTPSNLNENEEEETPEAKQEVARPVPSQPKLNLNKRGVWTTLNPSTFNKNSAEMGNSEDARKLVIFLTSNSSAKVQISGLGAGRLAEDRAYALRDFLFQNGIGLERMELVEGRNSSNELVAVQIN